MSGVVQGPLGCADSLILLIFADFWPKSSLGDDADFSGYGVDMIYSKHVNFTWLETVICWYEMFENQPVTQSSWHAQMRKKTIWLPQVRHVEISM